MAKIIFILMIFRVVLTLIKIKNMNTNLKLLMGLLLWLTACTTGKFSQLATKPEITALSLYSISETNKSQTIIIKGKNFDSNCRIRLTALNQRSAPIIPTKIKESEMEITIPKSWFTTIEKTNPKNKYIKKQLPKLFTIQIERRDGRVSNSLNINIAPSLLKIESLSFTNGKFELIPGTRTQLQIKFEKNPLLTDIPFRISAFKIDGNQKSFTKGIKGEGALIAQTGLSNASIDVDNDIEKGGYQLMVEIDKAKFNAVAWAKNNGVKLSDSVDIERLKSEIFGYYKEGYSLTQEIMVIDPGTLPPAGYQPHPPKALGTMRWWDIYHFDVIFLDKSWNETGFKLYKKNESTSAWELSGSLPANPAAGGTAKFVQLFDGNSTLPYSFRISAWNQWGETYSEEICYDPPTYTPRNFKISIGPGGYLRALSWDDFNADYLSKDFITVVEEIPFSSPRNILNSGLSSTMSWWYPTSDSIIIYPSASWILKRRFFHMFKEEFLNKVLSVQFYNGSCGISVDSIKIQKVGIPTPPSEFEIKDGKLRWKDNSSNEVEYILIWESRKYNFDWRQKPITEFRSVTLPASPGSGSFMEYPDIIQSQPQPEGTVFSNSYFVIASNGYGEAYSGGYIDWTLDNVPNVRVIDSDHNHITIKWDAVIDDHLSGYIIERQESSEDNDKEIGRVGASINSWKDNKVTEGNTYCYTVRAYNAVTSSDGFGSAVCEEVPQQQTTPKPNLAVDFFPNNEFKYGDTITGQIKIQNQGDLPSNSCNLHIRIYYDTLINNNSDSHYYCRYIDVPYNITIPSIQGHGEYTLDIEDNITFLLLCDDSIYTTDFFIDSLDQVDESDEGNNSVQRGVKVKKYN